MFCVTYSGHHSLLTGERNKTKQALWLGLPMKPPLFSPELHHVRVACKAFVAAHKAAIVPASRLKRRKRRQHYSKSDRRLQSVPFQGADKRKSERNYSEYESRKNLSLACEIKSIFHF